VGCRSCNQILSHGFKRAGRGSARRNTTRPLARRLSSNTPGRCRKGGGSHHGPYLGGGKFAPGAHDAAGAVIHATPKAKRVEYARRIAGLKGEHGTAGVAVMTIRYRSEA